jgi:hypothetical protein
MSVETATKIKDLNPSWPTGTDSISEGDNHIRLIKEVLLNDRGSGLISIEYHDITDIDGFRETEWTTIGSFTVAPDNDTSNIIYELSGAASVLSYNATGASLAIRFWNSTADALIGAEVSVAGFSRVIDNRGGGDTRVGDAFETYGTVLYKHKASHDSGTFTVNVQAKISEGVDSQCAIHSWSAVVMEKEV